LPSDIQLQDRRDEVVSEGRQEPPPVHLRRSQPVTVLLPRTKDWIASLPETVRPDVLAAQFARIANVICVVWPDQKDCQSYFDELLAHRRAGRNGFPAAVLRELNNLCGYYVGMHDAFDRSRK
jgi:hypothetical protein